MPLLPLEGEGPLPPAGEGFFRAQRQPLAEQDAQRVLVRPVLAISVLVLAFNLLGDGIRDATAPDG